MIAGASTARATWRSLYRPMFRFRIAISLACGAALGLPSTAFAHARLVRSTPASGAQLRIAPRTIQLWFSEQPEVALTAITLTGPTGVAIPLGVVSAVGDTAVSVRAPIGASLPAGHYTVAWQTVATDGHPSHGSFRFSVATGTALGITAGAISRASPPMMAGKVTQSMQERMAVQSPIYVGIRWLSFTALILVIGTVAFRFLVLPRTDSGAAHSALSAAVLPRLATLGLAAGLVLVAATIGRLYAEHAVVASGMDISPADMVRRTAWGSAWLLQMGAAVVACAGFTLVRMRLHSGWWVAALAALVLGVTPALSGHAIAAPQLRWLAVTADSLHVLAAGGWLGSLFALATVGVPVALVASASSDLRAATVVAALVNAFSPTALAFAAVVVVTGVISAWLRLDSVSALWRSSYGKVLLVKLALVVLVLAGGAFNWLRMRAALANAVSGGEATRRFRQSGMLELIAGALVIVVTAILVSTPTPMH